MSNQQVTCISLGKKKKKKSTQYSAYEKEDYAKIHNLNFKVAINSNSWGACG